MEFHSELRTWLERVIRQRILLVNRGASRKNPSLMFTHTSHLQRYLKAYRYETDKKMAKFFLMNKDSIESILPGAGSSGYEKRMREYAHYTTTSIQKLNNYENLHLWPDQQGTQQNARNI